MNKVIDLLGIGQMEKLLLDVQTAKLTRQIISSHNHSVGEENGADVSNKGRLSAKLRNSAAKWGVVLAGAASGDQ